MGDAHKARQPTDFAWFWCRVLACQGVGGPIPPPSDPLEEYVVPMTAARHVFNPLRSRRRTHTIYELEEREEVHAHRRGVTPSDGRKQGKRPRGGI